MLTIYSFKQVTETEGTMKVYGLPEVSEPGPLD